MKKKNIDIIVQGSGDFVLEKGKIREISGTPFYTYKEDNKIILSLTSNKGSRDNVFKNFNNGINVSNNSVNINGLVISTQGRKLIVNGDVDTVCVNGQTFELKKQDTALEKNQYLTYDFASYIKQISIQGSGSFSINGNKDNLIKDIIVLNVSGSGDIDIKRFNDIAVVASVAGSGDILLENISGNSIVATVTGSGDINAKKCNFESVSKNVVGSGDINGL